MKLAKLTPWTNKWTDFFDFTKSKDGTLNYSLNKQINPNFSTSLILMESIVSQLEALKGSKVESLNKITDADLDSINIDFSLDENAFRVPHSLRVLGSESPYTQSVMIIVFVDTADESLGLAM
jgi:hypothetical protein